MSHMMSTMDQGMHFQGTAAPERKTSPVPPPPAVEATLLDLITKQQQQINQLTAGISALCELVATQIDQTAMLLDGKDEEGTAVDMKGRPLG